MEPLGTPVHLYREPNPTLEAASIYMLGCLDMDRFQTLQRRLVYDVSGDNRTAAMILCEHPESVTIGRDGSIATVRRWNGIIEYVARGGGTIIHAPGQVACYPIVPLAALAMTPHCYLVQFRGMIQTIMAELDMEVSFNRHDILYGQARIGHLALSIRHGVTAFGAILNVCPDLTMLRQVDAEHDHGPITSIQRECRLTVRPQQIRQRFCELVAERFNIDRVSLFHNHPLLTERRHDYAHTATG